MREAHSFAAALAAGVVIACSSASCSAPNGIDYDGGGSGGGGSGCVSATSCPGAGPPSYKTEIAAIFQEDCVPCHGPTGTAGFDMTTYADVSGSAGAILDQVNGCDMPPLNGPTMTEAQRIAMTAWLRCGAPDN